MEIAQLVGLAAAIFGFAGSALLYLWPLTPEAGMAEAMLAAREHNNRVVIPKQKMGFGLLCLSFFLQVIALVAV